MFKLNLILLLTSALLALPANGERVGAIYVNGVRQLESGGGGGGVWGDIAGTLSAQTDLWSQLTNRYTIAEILALPVSSFGNDAGYLTNEYAFSSWLLTNTYVQVEQDGVFTNWLATATSVDDWDEVYAWYVGNYLTNTTTVTMTNQVSFPNGLYVAGTLIDGTVSDLSVANIVVDGSFIPDTDSAYDLGSSNLQWRSLYVSTNTIYMGGFALGVTSEGTITVTDTADTNAPPPVAFATEAWVSDAIQGKAAINDGSRFHSVWTGPTNSLYIVSPDGLYTNLLMTTP